IQSALRSGKIIIAGGITNAYVAEELLGVSIEEKHRYTAGIITQGAYQCVTAEEERIAPYVMINGRAADRPWVEVLDEFTAGDVFIKGASALDYTGMAGVLVSDPKGGTIGRALGTVGARGAHLVVPVGLEKMVPSVTQAAKAAGIGRMDFALGKAVGLIPMVSAEVVTEISALQMLFGVEATLIGSGGVGGSEGAVTLVIEGDRALEAFSLVKQIKGEPRVEARKRNCQCQAPCGRFNPNI
ncbi:MAG TPA: hypothetical protein VNU93_00170, partial [Verrucomicrobiae bacterium]|nr:hypothetical protein [Verrucomicrobiae bacterium]